MAGFSNSRVLFRRVAVVAQLVLAATLISFRPAIGASPLTLQVETSDTLPGFHIGDLSSYLAQHMAEAGLVDWRFEPTKGDSTAPDRVVWRFQLDPYAGGEVRTFERPRMAERIFGAYRRVTIEARLYLNGQYQTLVEKQAVVVGGPNDPTLAAAVADVARSLLGPEGAYHAIVTGQHPAPRTQ